jgi:ATPase subunit of ABC transporter with duplicated ATPase domains
MLSAVGITKFQGAQLILDHVSLSVGPRTRVGVVGPNGIGKTTFLRILAGLDDPDEGRVERAPATLTVGYLPQEVDTQPGETLLAYLARRTGVADAEAELERLTKELEHDPDALDAYTEALDRFLALGGDDLAARAGAVCADVGLPHDRLEVAVGELSGGQASRAALAAILLSRFDVFLLDEPTNDLDFAGLDRLERFLVELEGGVVVVSHDRAFLDRSVTRVLELQEETHVGVEYAGGWSEFVEARSLARSQQYDAYDKYQSERSRLVERARTQRSWSEQGVRNQKKRPRDHDKAQQGFVKNRTEKQASKVRATEQRLANLTAVDKPWEGWQLNLSLTPKARSGDVVARLEQAVVRRGSFVLGPIDLEIAWQERLAILGPNGSGKSTLLNALLGRLPLESGRRWLGPGVVVGEMEQRRDHYLDDRPLVDAFVADTGLIPSEARTLLAKFGLTADHVTRPGRALSPGERTRAGMAALMASGVNCLVLDEPTNHLDLMAIEQLENALDGFEGSLILVTHDRWLLDRVELTRTLDL